MGRRVYRPVSTGGGGYGISESQINALLASKANVTDLVTINNTLANKADTSLLADKVSGTDLDTLLLTKANTSHNHTSVNITDLMTSIDNRLATKISELGMVGWGTNYQDFTGSRAFGVQYPAHTKHMLLNLTVQCSGGGSGRYGVYLDGNFAGVISPIEYQGGGGVYTGADSFVIPAGKAYMIANDQGAFGSLAIVGWKELR